MTTSLPIDKVLAKLRGVRRRGSKAIAYCPAHEDLEGNLRVTVAESLLNDAGKWPGGGGVNG